MQNINPSSLIYNNIFHLNKYDKKRMIITFITLFILLMTPLLGLQRELNFIFFSIIIFLYSLLSLRLIFGLFIILLPIPFVATIGPVNINLMDIITSTFFFHLLISKEKSIPKRFINFNNLIIAYYLFFFIWTINGPLSLNILTLLLRYVFEPLVIYFTAKKIIKSKKELIIIIELLIFSTFISSIFALYQFTFLFDKPAWRELYTSMVEYGFYPDYEFAFDKSDNIIYRKPSGFFQYGGELSCFIPVVIYLALYYLKTFKLKRFKYYLIIFSLIIMFIALILSFTRGMVFAFIISFIFYILFVDKKLFIMFLLFSILVLIMSINYIPKYMVQGYLLQQRSETMSTRFRLTKEALEEIKNVKVLIFGTTDPDRPQSHNKFVDELHTKGILGFLIYITLQIKLLKYALRKRKKYLLFPLLIFWALVSLTTAAPYGTYQTHFLFPLILIICIII